MFKSAKFAPLALLLAFALPCLGQKANIQKNPNTNEIVGNLEAGAYSIEATEVKYSVREIGFAYVEMNGDDETGHVVQDESDAVPTRPFATIGAALDALEGVEYAVVKIGLGDFDSPADDVGPTNTPPCALYGGSKLRGNLAIIGSGRPTVRADETGLEGGTRLKGHLIFDTSRSNVTIANLGVDYGSTIAAALTSGNARDALAFTDVAYSDSTPEPATNVRLENVAGMCKAKTSAFHAVLLDNVDGGSATDILTKFGIHGAVFKVRNFQFARIRNFDHENEGTIVKSDAHWPVFNVTGRDIIATGCGFAVALCGERPGGDPDDALHDILLSGVISSGCTRDINFVTTYGMKNVEVRDCLVTHDGITDDPRINVTAAMANPETVKVNGHPIQADLRSPSLLMWKASMALPNTGDFDLTSNFTFAFEVSANDYRAGDGVSKTLVAPVSAGGPQLIVNQFGVLALVSNATGGSGSVASSALGWLPNKRYWIVVTVASGTTVKIYRDGQIVASGLMLASFSARTRQLGCGPSYSDPWNGTIYRAPLYSRTLSADEVVQVGKYGQALDATGLLFQMDLSASSGSTIEGGANDGALSADTGSGGFTAILK